MPSDASWTPECKICQSATTYLGSKRGTFKTDREFEIFRCCSCRFSFVANPWTDYKQIYSEAYYRGLGADPYVDYVFELERPEHTVRCYEWQGILNVINSCFPLSKQTRWLDYGCGNGGLVRYCRANIGCEAIGYEEGWIRDRASNSGIPMLECHQLDELAGSFDVVTAIEVLEHVPEPMRELARIRSLLRPGGLFFYTTGNAAPFRNKLLEWHYLVPEVHISFYEPDTLAEALRRTGFSAEFRGCLPGFDDIIRFKVLKNLGIRKISPIEKVLPWPVLSRLVDRQRQVTAFPIAWAAGASTDRKLPSERTESSAAPNRAIGTAGGA